MGLDKELQQRRFDLAAAGRKADGSLCFGKYTLPDGKEVEAVFISTWEDDFETSCLTPIAVMLEAKDIVVQRRPKSRGALAPEPEDYPEGLETMTLD